MKNTRTYVHKALFSDKCFQAFPLHFHLKHWTVKSLETVLNNTSFWTTTSVKHTYQQERTLFHSFNSSSLLSSPANSHSTGASHDAGPLRLHLYVTSREGLINTYKIAGFLALDCTWLFLQTQFAILLIVNTPLVHWVHETQGLRNVF